MSSLVDLPVFADEAIYIRWSQLIMDDWKRFFFFSMNDGKTPLFIWAMVPFQYLFKDQLFAGRIVSLLVGILQVCVNINIVKKLGGRRKTQILAGLFTTILPFWYFHHRIALMDGMMTLLFSVSYLLLLKSLTQKVDEKGKLDFRKDIINKEALPTLFVAGLSFGLAILAKIPAILFIPAFFLTILLPKKLSKKFVRLSIIKASLVSALGLAVFGLLIFNPTFGQLFSRGSDFLFPLNEVLLGKWVETTASIPNYILYFLVYLTPGLLIFSIIGLFSKTHQKVVHMLFWSGIFFVLPIAFMGKIVYPRYLFPASMFFTLASVMGLESLILNTFKTQAKLWKKILVGSIVALLISNSIASSIDYINYSLTNASKTPFVSSDVVQYLYEWSSGHGIKETVDLIQKESENQTIAVATEGYFGTLPDGILMYLHNRDVDNIYVEGVGYPLTDIPKSFAQRARDFDRQWLVVNSHRMKIDIDRSFLISEFCRPYNGPCLQVWDLSDEFESFVK